MSTSGKILLGDLSNGDYLKLALVEAGKRPAGVRLYGCSCAADLENAILSYLADNAITTLKGAAFSTSGWEIDGQINLVHFGFALDRYALCDLLKIPRVSIVNNFVAKALAVPVLEENERLLVCGKAVSPNEVVAIVGPTTGLGGAFLAPDGHGGWVATHCEGGHADFAPCNLLEIEILKLMMENYGHVSRERAVSAPGLSELWRCLSIIGGETPEALSVDEILAQAYIGNERAKTAISIQTELYAGMAADFALMTGAKGGVYLCGSYLDTLGRLFDHEVFTKRFYEKGRVSSYVKDIPVYRIIAQEPEILGISTLFDDL
jgi:glucokinase